MVLGNEGVGLRTLVRRACTHMVRIGGATPARGEGEGLVDSLNVSVAAGILLHELLVRSGPPAQPVAAEAVEAVAVVEAVEVGAVPLLEVEGQEAL